MVEPQRQIFKAISSTQYWIIIMCSENVQCMQVCVIHDIKIVTLKCVIERFWASDFLTKDVFSKTQCYAVQRSGDIYVISYTNYTPRLSS